MNEDIILEICKRYNLGNKHETPIPVTGGLIHKTWKLRTDKGQYAIKELNEKIMSQPDTLEAFELSEVMATKFLHAKVPAIVSLSSNGTHVQHISNSYVLVYKWVEGITLSTEAANVKQAYTIGEIIGKIHSVHISEPSVQVGLPQIFTNFHWEELILKIKAILPEYANSFESVLNWNSNSSKIINVLKNNLIVTHGDIDQKNVIWTDETTPNIIDWEGVSVTNPGLEIIDAALNWSGLLSGTVNIDSMKAVIDGYIDTGGKIYESIDILLSACIIKWLPWLEFNMRRAVQPLQDDEVLKLSITQVKNTLSSIELIANNKEAWIDSLS